MSVIDKIQHYQRSIENCTDNEERILYCISKLDSLPVTVQHLQETGVGRTVNALRKYDGDIGNAAKVLVAKWKVMVADEDSSEEEDEDEACVPDAPETYSDSPESPAQEEHITFNGVRYGNEQSKQSHSHRMEENIASVERHNLKHVSKQDQKSRHENRSSGDSERSGSSKDHQEKSDRHERSKHTSKHESKSERKPSAKESRNNKSNLKKSDEESSKDKSQIRSKSSRKVPDESFNTDETSRTENGEEYCKKRKLDHADCAKKKNKKRKNSDDENHKDSAALSSSEKHSSSSHIATKHEFDRKLSGIKIKQESDTYSPEHQTSIDKVNIKTEIKSEPADLHEKHQSSSSKSRSKESSSSKVKDSEGKQKHRKDESHIKSEKKTSQHSSKESSKSKNHHSSSSGSASSKNKSNDKKKEPKEERQKSSESKDHKSSSRSSSSKHKIKQEINGDEGIDCNSGTSFAEALGMCTIPPTKKRSTSAVTVGSTKTTKLETNAPSSTSNKKPISAKTESAGTENPHNPPSLLAPNVKLEPLSVDLASTLPEISPNYKPLPYINPLHRKEEDKVLDDVIYVKNQRTKVYSGNKAGYTSVPTLYEMCIRILIENIHALEFTGGVPYDILKPVLERATADQLFTLEHYNPYLIEDTDALWQYHCNREFRNKQREEMESWREMYIRCLEEREAKLKTLTANIKQSIDKSLPVRSTKLAYVDNVVKPPRNVLKKQAKYGTANVTPTSTSDLKKKLIAGGGSTAATNIAVPPPPMARGRTSSSGVVKKTKAPLMAKALQLIKGRYKR